MKDMQTVTNHAKDAIRKRTKLRVSQIKEMIRKKHVVILKKKPGIPKNFYLLHSPFDSKDYVAIENEYTGVLITVLHFYFQCNFALQITQDMRDEARRLSNEYFFIKPKVEEVTPVPVPTIQTVEKVTTGGINPPANNFIVHVYYHLSCGSERSKACFKVDAEQYGGDVGLFLKDTSLDENIYKNIPEDIRYSVSGISVQLTKKGKRAFLDQDRVNSIVRKMP